MDKFNVDGENANSVIMYALIKMAARNRAMEQILLEHIANNDESKFKELASHFDETTAFHRQKIYDDLFSHYASLKEIFGDLDEILKGPTPGEPE